jgi:methionine-gamma-lyase
MAAVSQALLGLLRPGDRLVVHKEKFVGVRFLLDDFIRGYGVRIAEVDAKDVNEVARALHEPTALLFFEAVSHPFLGVVDVPSVLSVARKRGVLTLVDNTVLTPALFRPIDYGADLVVHSTTKYVGGHGDAMGGVITARTPELAKTLRKARRIFGGILSPSVAYFLLRGLRTLPLRVERHCDNAFEVARYLERHPRVQAVHYPGLPSSKHHQVARSFLTRFGGVVGFELRSDVDKERFGKALRLSKVRLSFGEPATTVLIQDEVEVNRISVGLEDAGDIIRDLEQALASA